MPMTQEPGEDPGEAEWRRILDKLRRLVSSRRFPFGNASEVADCLADLAVKLCSHWRGIPKKLDYEDAYLSQAIRNWIKDRRKGRHDEPLSDFDAADAADAACDAELLESTIDRRLDCITLVRAWSSRRDEDASLCRILLLWLRASPEWLREDPELKRGLEPAVAFLRTFQPFSREAAGRLEQAARKALASLLIDFLATSARGHTLQSRKLWSKRREDKSRLEALLAILTPLISTDWDEVARVRRDMRSTERAGERVTLIVRPQLVQEARPAEGGKGKPRLVRRAARRIEATVVDSSENGLGVLVADERNNGVEKGVGVQVVESGCGTGGRRKDGRIVRVLQHTGNPDRAVILGIEFGG